MAFLLEGATCAASTAASFALYSLAWATVVQGFAGVGAGVGAGWQHCFCPHLRLKHTAPAFWGMVPAAHVKLAQVGGGGVVVAVDAGVVVTVVAGVVVTGATQHCSLSHLPNLHGALLQAAGPGVPQGSELVAALAAGAALKLNPAGHLKLQQEGGTGVVVAVVAGVVVTVVAGVVV